MRLKEVLSSPAVDWCGDVIIAAEEHNANLQVSLTFDIDTIRGLLDQFLDLSLAVLPTISTEKECLKDNV